MSEHMQPIDPVTAAMLMGQVPDPCEPIIEISRKVLTRLMDVAEFGDHLERVEKDRLLAHLRDVLAEKQPELWAMHSPGPGEVHPMISKEEAERQQSELLALCKKQFPEIAITVNVIPSPFSPLEHFEILAGELSEQVASLRKAVATGSTTAPVGAMPPEIPRNLLGKIVDELFGGAIEDTSAIEDLYRVIAREYRAAPAVVKQQLTTATTVAMPAGLHPDTQDLVNRFATALAVKLHAAELKHGYSNGWKDPAWMDECRQKLIEHLAKGDPRDVAAYCAFLWHHCQSTAPLITEGYVLAPQEIHLSASDIELINGMCGDGNEESGYGQYQDGTLYIGYAEQDDGSKVYGLHISCDECPEEGVTTLAEFAAAPLSAKPVQQEQQP